MAKVSIAVTEACLQWMRNNWNDARPEIKKQYVEMAKNLEDNNGSSR